MRAMATRPKPLPKLDDAERHSMAAPGVIGAFSEEHAAELTGLSRHQLRVLAEVGLLTPSYGEASGLPYGRIYSFRDLVSLRVLNDLRNRNSVPIWHLKEVHKELSALSDEPWTSKVLYVLKGRVIVAETSGRRRQAAGKEQILDHVPLRPVVASLHSAISELNRRDKAKIGKVIQAKFIAQGQPVIEGTRIPVSMIKSFAAGGYSAARIIKEFPELTEADVMAAIVYESAGAAA